MRSSCKSKEVRGDKEGVENLERMKKSEITALGSRRES